MVGDSRVDISNPKEAQARVRAIVVHRRFPDECPGHNPERVAMHPVPLEDQEAEAAVMYYAEAIHRGEMTFNEIRKRESSGG